MPLSIRTHRQGRVRHEISLYICILAQWKADYKEEVFAWHRKCENTGGRGDCASGIMPAACLIVTMAVVSTMVQAASGKFPAYGRCKNH